MKKIEKLYTQKEVAQLLHMSLCVVSRKIPVWHREGRIHVGDIVVAGTRNLWPESVVLKLLTSFQGRDKQEEKKTKRGRKPCQR